MPAATELDHRTYIPIAHPGDDVKALFKQYGAVRLHDYGFTVDSFDKFVGDFNESTLTDYSGGYLGKSGRPKTSNNTFEASNVPPNFYFPPHNDLSYFYEQDRMPGIILFCCITPALKGGWTPLFNSNHAFKLLPESVAEKIRSRKLSYVWTIPRSGVSGEMKVLPTSWETFFGTGDPERVQELVEELRFSKHEYLCLDEEKPDERTHLRLYMNGPMVTQHPTSGQDILFINLGQSPEARRHFAKNYASDEAYQAVLRGTQEFLTLDAPYVVWADTNTPIEEDVMQHIISAYERSRLDWGWSQPGEVIIFDNFLFAHGRDTFEGPRSVITSFGNISDERMPGPECRAFETMSKLAPIAA